MKGQKLFVRHAAPSDTAELGEFYSKEGVSQPSPSGSALIGKLVGEIVAHLCFTSSDSSIRIESIHVARLLRRKRIGRFMVSELERLVADDRIERIEAAARCDAAEFLRAIGFQVSSDNETLFRSINPQEVP